MKLWSIDFKILRMWLFWILGWFTYCCMFWLGSTDMNTESSASQLFPAPAPPPPQPPLQNVETFGSFLGEEIVANWRRSLERTILSQGSLPHHLARAGLPPPEGRSSVGGPLASSPINASPPPSHTPTSNPDDAGKCLFLRVFLLVSYLLSYFLLCSFMFSSLVC